VKFYRSVVVTKAVNERFIKVLQDTPQDLITSKERFRENANVKLGQEVKVKENMQESKKVLPVLFHENFYKIHRVHLEVFNSIRRSSNS
jgi:hypothetical protein